MAFAVPQPVTKRLKAMDVTSGKEIREGWDPMDMSYMQLLDAAGPTEEAPAEAEDAPPDPGEVIKVFEEAKGNLDILVDVVTNLERAFLEAKPFSAGRRPGVKREDAVANGLQARVASTSASLGRVSRRLAEGAEALQAHADREERFYRQLRQLQMFWKVHLNPRVIDCPFMVDLALPEQPPPPAAALAAAAAAAAAAGGGGATPGAGSAAAASAAAGAHAAAAAAAAAGGAADGGAGQPLTGNTYELGGGSLLVPLMKDEAGQMRVQVELPEERPDVNDAARRGSTRLNAKGARTLMVAGSRRVHALLLQLQRRQMWRQVAAGLERDAAALGGGGAGGGGGHPVHASLARLASQNVLVTPDPSLAALRPLMLEHLLSCRLPPPYRPPPPAPPRAGRPALGPPGSGPGAAGSGPGRPLSGLPLLPDLAALLNQMVFRDHQRYHLDLEAHALPYVSLRWRPCAASMLTSAMEIRVGRAGHRVLAVVRDGRSDVEGVVQPTGPQAGSGAGGSRWVRDTQMGFSRHDVPCVLRSVLQTLGVPLDRLLGVHVPPQHAPPHHGPHAPHAPHGPHAAHHHGPGPAPHGPAALHAPHAPHAAGQGHTPAPGPGPAQNHAQVSTPTPAPGQGQGQGQGVADPMQT
ncbi:hypothetical protein HYH03_015287 [Edaphochlamys debaryana]|uniref:Uncharacterized protein n=1 Tax=Edaphochlamys debaryana TaxID=47281 RepID=A0A836BSQ7_9CHLO|nr:hypothetical protein HYH03_015287 [Edaphochlamys debaryana]|eukprot:KAG2486084.1 hypothetical protein HYH03_015287 [Edaphochlamys debaryana]